MKMTVSSIVASNRTRHHPRLNLGRLQRQMNRVLVLFLVLQLDRLQRLAEPIDRVSLRHQSGQIGVAVHRPGDRVQQVGGRAGVESRVRRRDLTQRAARPIEPRERRSTEVIRVDGIDDAVDEGPVGRLRFERQLPHVQRMLDNRRPSLIEPGLSGHHQRQGSQHRQKLNDDPSSQGLDPSHTLRSAVRSLVAIAGDFFSGGCDGFQPHAFQASTRPFPLLRLCHAHLECAGARRCGPIDGRQLSKN